MIRLFVPKHLSHVSAVHDLIAYLAAIEIRIVLGAGWNMYGDRVLRPEFRELCHSVSFSTVAMMALANASASRMGSGP
ncbi:hypothetical protein MPLSOD_90068 [Mesorhizobium sp. SOD10]|nr:hypothetical protein MPLSOD_90068 [Mesorhizobium sp. SOD10]